MAARAEELQVVQAPAIAFDVIDLVSGAAARPALTVVAIDHRLPNRVRHESRPSVVPSAQDVGTFDLNCLSNVGLPKRTVSDPLAVLTNELSLVATQLGAEERSVRDGCVAVRAWERGGD